MTAVPAARELDPRFGPAFRVTLGRAALAVVVAVLVADSFAHQAPVGLLVTLAALALALDFVDGVVARRTGTETAFGARFDGEVDAFLILALSVYVAPALGAWVLLIGAARYVFGAGEWLLPWMRAPLPVRRWRKVVAALQGILLTVAAADVVPRSAMQALLLVALALLAASMGECVWWLWRHRDAGVQPSVAVTVLALVLTWLAIVAPHEPWHFDAASFARLPLELIAFVALAAVLPDTPRRALVVVAGAVLGVLTIVKVLDIGFFTAFDRPFDPVSDSTYVGIGVETLGDAIGHAKAIAAAAAIALLFLAFLALPVAALLRLMRVATNQRSRVLTAAAVLGVVWAVLRIAGAPVATTSSASLVVHEVELVRSGLHAREVLAREIPRDRFKATPGSRLLTGLRGKDVVLVFVESYGRVAVGDPGIAAGVGAVLDRGTAELADAGFAARTGFLTSSTFGGLSWLAHATLQSGIRIGTQRGYDQLVTSDRLTLTTAFKRAGWRAVGVMPANKRHWPEGADFYRFDRVYDRRDVGYRGPSYGVPSMPDQYALLALQRLELGREHHGPLFAEVDLLSSHAPWERIPRLIGWDDVGDGSIFDRIPDAESSHASLFGDSDRARAAYGHSIEYSLRTLVSFVQRYGDDDLVVIALGDHQPATEVTGDRASHDVPISVIARDPKVLERIAGWGWDDGLRPGPDAPVWPMNAFRDRFLGAFGAERR